ncbi:unnamed protein product [Cylicostephanus goldi]|uniref:PARP-type domain-containing protein n=1 Tax=Cylicostephanus goldi TaxID=71465 RepID=A0A3P6UC93_CYLGO|nr:unnamed protein product [Cylicostephanus goldi]
MKCKEVIPQKQIKFGLHAGWHHQQCLFSNITFGGYIEEMNGFAYLTEEDQEKLLVELKDFTVPYLDEIDDDEEDESGVKKGEGKENDKAGKRPPDATNGDQIPAKKRKQSEENSNREKLKKQSNVLWELRRELNDNLTKAEMVELLKENGQKPLKNDRMLDHLVDCVVFGVPLPCPKCGGQLCYRFLHIFICYFSIPLECSFLFFFKIFK